MRTVTAAWRKKWRIAALAMLLAPMLWAGLPSAGAGEAREVYWSDPQTGLAIGGYDPLSYFVDKTPRMGRPEHQLSWQGVVWQFENEGNLAAFRDTPHIYAPRFGGYSAPALARDIAVAGSPLIWDIHRERLYLFYSPAHRFIWRQDPVGMAAQAESHWPGVARTIAR